MVGRFDVILTGTERVESNYGKETYLYANFLQKNEVQRVKVEKAEMFKSLSILPELQRLSVEMDVSVRSWNGSVYVNYKLVRFDEIKEMQKKS